MVSDEKKDLMEKDVIQIMSDCVYLSILENNQPLIIMKHTIINSIVLGFLILFSWNVLHAQNPGIHPVHGHSCGFEMAIQMYEKQYPGFIEAYRKTFEQTKHLKEPNHSRDEILTIDVVFHVVWKEASENLHDTIILNQLARINKDFRLLNENRDDIRGIFKDRQTDARVEFRLKEIRRVKTNSNFALSLSGLPDNVKRTTSGGSNAVTPANTLNIWICHIRPIPILGAQILGYAYPPAGLINWPAGSEAPSADLDGVVVDFRTVGSNNPNKLVFQGQEYKSEGRTMVHEIGHYLGLRHIWGDGSLFSSSSCDVDDGMEDTPNQGAQTGFSCDKTRNTCTDPQNDLPDMLENYMDYSLEECQNIFTKDQVGHMRKTLMFQRKGLIDMQSGSSEAGQIATVSLFPNPNDGHFVLQNNDLSRSCYYTIQNAMGQICRQSKIGGGETEEIVITSDPGLYILRIWDSQNKKSEVTKFVIHR